MKKWLTDFVQTSMSVLQDWTNAIIQNRSTNEGSAGRTEETTLKKTFIQKNKLLSIFARPFQTTLSDNIITANSLSSNEMCCSQEEIFICTILIIISTWWSWDQKYSVVVLENETFRFFDQIMQNWIQMNYLLELKQQLCRSIQFYTTLKFNE